MLYTNMTHAKSGLLVTQSFGGLKIVEHLEQLTGCFNLCVW